MNNQNNVHLNQFKERDLDLLNRSIDGEINSDEEEELKSLLATSEELRTLSNELNTVNRLLGELPEVEPPEYLHETIERQVRLPVQSHTGLKRPGGLGSWLNANWFRSGFALAAGVLITVGVYEMGSEPINVRDSASLSGTVIKPRPADQQGVLLDSIQLKTEKLNGLVELHAEGDLISLDVQLTSNGSSEVIVNFSGRGLELDGLGHMKDSVDAVSLQDGAIHLTSSGEQHYTLRLRRTSDMQKAMPLELEFFTGNELVQKASLDTSRF